MYINSDVVPGLLSIEISSLEEDIFFIDQEILALSANLAVEICT